MSHTNSTTNFGLPQFITTDKPAWLTDVNVAYSAIDTAMKNNQTAASNAQNDATQALSDASTADGKATTADSKASGAVASLAENFEVTNTYNVDDLVMYNNLLYICTTAVEVPGPWTGVTNWARTTCDTLISLNSSKLDNLNGSIIPLDSSDPNNMIDDEVNRKQDKYWKKLSHAFELTGNNTGTWSFTDNLATSNYTDINFTISLTSTDGPIRSSLNATRLGFESFGVFYDYTIGSDRIIFQINKATNNSFTVSGTNLGGLSSRIYVMAYYR